MQGTQSFLLSLCCAEHIWSWLYHTQSFDYFGSHPLEPVTKGSRNQPPPKKPFTLCDERLIFTKHCPSRQATQKVGKQPERKLSNFANRHKIEIAAVWKIAMNFSNRRDLYFVADCKIQSKFWRPKIKCCQSPEMHFDKFSRRSDPCSKGNGSSENIVPR